MAKRKIIEDAWDLVQKGKPDECWEWLGSKNSTGYGSIKVSQKTYSAHRLIYGLTYPNTISYKAPKNKSLKEFILHKCDNRSCCNPNHMTLVNYDDNNKDAKNKGRSKAVYGANHKNAKLTQEQANKVRDLHSIGINYSQLGIFFGINANNISRICRNISYIENRG